MAIKSGYWRIGVCYPSIDRKTEQSQIVYNKESWCLLKKFVNQYAVMHDGKEVELSHCVS